MASGFPQTGRWSVGLCECGDKSFTCCLALCLPCITFGQIAEMVDEGHGSCIGHACVYGLLMFAGCHCLYSCMYREKLRSKFGLPAEPCCDCCVHWCCEACALCQEHAELKKRGLDPSKGWAAQARVPPMPPSMQRY